MFEHDRNVGFDPRKDVLVSRKVIKWTVEGFSKDEDRIDMGLGHLWTFRACEEAQLEGQFMDTLPILFDCGKDQGTVLGKKYGIESTSSTKIEQGNGVLFWVHQKVGPIRICLHQTKLKDLPKT